ncbi:MAG: carboxypeptidase-like regulatory domain-containing protein [Saprospiraceae bacterium]
MKNILYFCSSNNVIMRISSFISFVIGIVLFTLNRTDVKAQSMILQGSIFDKGNNESLIGATIYISELQKGEVTDLDGHYVFQSIKPGNYTLITSYVGYITDTLQVSISSEIVNKDIFLNIESKVLNEVTISAQAEGQIAAVNRQISDENIKNVVSAKRIQEVPDANAAETLGRLSGVSLVRSGGEGSKVSIRGLAPVFNKIQVEGIKMASTGEEDRSTDLSMISPYMLEGIELAKAAMPENEADAIGGSVNFVLRSAPDQKTFDALLQTGYANYKNRFENQKIVLGGSQRFFNKKFGIFAQIDLDQRDRSSNAVNVGYINRTNLPDSFPISMGSMALRDVDLYVKRGGASIVMDYKLKNGSIRFSNFGSVIQKDEINQYETFNPFFNTHTYGLSQTENKLQVFNNALRLDKKIGLFDVDLGLTYAYSKNNTPDSKNFYATESNAFTPAGTLANNPDTLLANTRNILSKGIVQQVDKSQSLTKESEKGAFINITYPMSIAKGLHLKLKIGAKYKILEKDFDINYQKIPVAQSGHGSTFVKKAIQTLDFIGTTVSPDATILPYDIFTVPNSDSKFDNNRYSLQNKPDLDRVNDFLSTAEPFYFIDYAPSTKDDYKGEEKYKAGYIQPVFSIGKSLMFIPGMRYEKVNTAYQGVRGNNTIQNWDAGYAHSDTTIYNENAFLLPMIHLRYKMNSWSDIRMAYTHTLARPNFSVIIPKWDIGLNAVNWNDPFLIPSLAKNVDIYYSIYTNKIGLLTAGGFYKSIENLIYNSGNTVIDSLDIIKNGFPTNLIGTTISKIVNNSSPATIYGFELEWQTRFWYLNNFLSKFILNINYTQTFSKVSYDRTVLKQVFTQEPPYVKLEEEVSPYSERLLFQPTNIFNFTIGFEDKGWASRLSFLYQNDIFSTPNFFSQLRGATAAYYRFDFNISKKLPWKGFEILANVNNINSAFEKDELISNGSIIKQQFYGMTADLGIRYRLK